MYPKIYIYIYFHIIFVFLLFRSKPLFFLEPPANWLFCRYHFLVYWSCYCRRWVVKAGRGRGHSDEPFFFFTVSRSWFNVALACSSAACKLPVFPRQSSLIVVGSEESLSWTIALVNSRCIEVLFLTYFCSQFNVEHLGVKRCKISSTKAAASANFCKRTSRVSLC